jgi:hypothetical protein
MRSVRAHMEYIGLHVDQQSGQDLKIFGIVNPRYLLSWWSNRVGLVIGPTRSAWRFAPCHG